MPKSIEAEGVTVDEAIQNALNALGLGRDSVEIEILHHPRSGFLGIGARRAKVRATLREQVMRDGEEFDMAPDAGERGRRRRRSGRRRSPRGGEGRPPEAKPSTQAPAQGRRGGSGRATPQAAAGSGQTAAAGSRGGLPGGEEARGGGRGGRRRGGRRSGRGGDADAQRARPAEDAQRGGSAAPAGGEARQRTERGSDASETRAEGARAGASSRRVDIEELLRRAIGIAEQLMNRMGFEARVSGAIDGGALSITIDADDGGEILIGRRGTTLDALEHVIARMTLGTDPGARVRVVVDVCGYRERRRAALVELAGKIKEHAVAAGRKAQLTPLSPQDRSVFLDALAGDEMVTTRALGTGFYRRILVVPKGIPSDRMSTDDFGDDGELMTGATPDETEREVQAGESDPLEADEVPGEAGDADAPASDRGDGGSSQGAA